MTGPGQAPRNARSDARSVYAGLDNRLFGDDLLRLAVARAAAATSACSGVARCGPIFTRIRCPATNTSVAVLGRARRCTGCCRAPGLPVSVSSRASTTPASPGGQSAVTTWAGRPFVPVTGVIQASAARLEQQAKHFAEQFARHIVQRSLYDDQRLDAARRRGSHQLAEQRGQHIGLARYLPRVGTASVRRQPYGGQRTVLDSLAHAAVRPRSASPSPRSYQKLVLRHLIEGPSHGTLASAASCVLSSHGEKGDLNRTSKYLINPARSAIGKRVTRQLVQVGAPYVVVETAWGKCRFWQGGVWLDGAKDFVTVPGGTSMAKRFADQREQTRISRHTSQVRDLWNSRADDWPGKYASGRLAGRLPLFAAELHDRIGDGRVLDLGCGSGELARHLASLGYRLTGCDIAPQMLERAQTAASSVLVYVSDISAVLRETARVLRPNGLLLCTVPVMSHPVRWGESPLRLDAGITQFRCLCGRVWPRLGSHLTYLRLSRQRRSVYWWQAKGRHGRFELVPLANGAVPRARLRCSYSFDRPSAMATPSCCTVPVLG